MDGGPTSSIAAFAEATVSLVASGALTVGGVLTEEAAVSNVLAGHLPLGLWEGWMGAVALFVGVYLLGYRRLYRSIRTARLGN
ncbi:MAG: hypothetical protein ABEJ55_05855 [Halanaeroarchaeum sp.]